MAPITLITADEFLSLRTEGERGHWDSLRLHWWPGIIWTLVLTTTRERKVRTTEELDAVMKEPMTVAPTRNAWIHESLEDEARRLWEMRKTSGETS